MKVAFFNEQGDIYESQDIVLEDKEKTILTYDGSKRPVAIFLNYQDETFIKTRLDEHTLQFVKQKVASVSDELTRAMLWQSLYNMTKDGRLSTYRFIQIAKEAIIQESSDPCLSTILTYCTASLNFVPRVLKDNYIKATAVRSYLKSLT